MKKPILLLALALGLAGCQTIQTVSTSNDLWIGLEEIELIRVWGVPKRTYATGGRKFVVFVDQRTITSDGIPPTYVTTTDGDTSVSRPVGGVPPSTRTLVCTTTFELTGTRIVGWRNEGSGCHSRPPAM